MMVWLYQMVWTLTQFMVDSRGENQKMTICMDSIGAKIIADSIEAGLLT